jgi:hypothetical protein
LTTAVRPGWTVTVVGGVGRWVPSVFVASSACLTSFDAAAVLVIEICTS